MKKKITKQLDWERQFADKFLTVLATPDYSCNPAGSYSVEPLIKFIKQRDQHLKEEIEKLYVYDLNLGVSLISKGAVLELLKKI